MKKLLIVLAALGTLPLPTFAAAPYYIAGDFNGWAANGNLMTETATGSGIWTVPLSLTPGRHEFKVTDGTWTWNYPGPNSWLVADASGSVTISYDVNTSSDGWLTTSQRIGVSASGNPTTWTAVGNWQGWDNANAATAMTPVGEGIYEYSQRLTPGAYSWKAVVTGTWDSISMDGRSVGTANYDFNVTAENDLAIFKVNALNGTVQLQLVPEPSTVALLGVALAGLLCFRRRQ